MDEIIKIIYAKSEDGQNYLKELSDRKEVVQKDVLDTVEDILENIKSKGDEALLQYTNKFDSNLINLDNIRVSPEEIEEAYENVDSSFLEAIKTSKENITYFHERQKRQSFIITKEKGVIMGQLIRALSKVGIYVPGGTASYPSSVLMNAIPAKVAEVEDIVMVTPPGKDGKINPNILVAADTAGVKSIYKIGGAQAIGALAYGTNTIPKVDKIVGPGNIYVALAKKSVYGSVNIDMIAGPSEILIVADSSANPKFIAADLMSQAEHDVLASAVLVTDSIGLGEKVREELTVQVEKLERKEIILSSLKNFGAIIIADNIKDVVDMANSIAPEHIELCVKEPFLLLGDIKNAGSIFLGSYSPEPLGDYMAGPNHVLPTSGTARFFSPLSVDDFIKKSSYLFYTEESLETVKDKIVTLAETEGLTAHANSIKVRFENKA